MTINCVQTLPSTEKEIQVKILGFGKYYERIKKTKYELTHERLTVLKSIGKRPERDSPDLRIVSRTTTACSWLSGFVCSGPVQTFVCASSTTRLGCGISDGLYDVEIVGFRMSASRNPAPSIVAADLTAR